MFVFSVKSRRSKIAAVAVIVLLLVLAFVVISQLEDGSVHRDGNGVTSPHEQVRASAAGEISYDAADASERLAFIAQFGWTVREEPAEVIEVMIPAEFDEIYSKYNELQQSQGLDLSSCRGDRVKRWSYIVTNYPGLEDSGDVRLNMLIKDGRVVGGDVCSLAEDGFMQGFAA